MCLAIPALVISATDRTAVVDHGGVRLSVRLDALSEPVEPGDYVLIHTGFAIRRLAAEDGEETLKLFDDLAASLADSPPLTAPHPAQTRPGSDPSDSPEAPLS